MATVEQLYKNFGVLADAKEKAGEVSVEVTNHPISFWRRRIADWVIQWLGRLRRLNLLSLTSTCHHNYVNYSYMNRHYYQSYILPYSQFAEPKRCRFVFNFPGQVEGSDSHSVHGLIDLFCIRLSLRTYLSDYSRGCFDNLLLLVYYPTRKTSTYSHQTSHISVLLQFRPAPRKSPSKCSPMMTKLRMVYLLHLYCA